MKIGEFVKIYDVGPLAEILKIENDKLYLRLEGEEFWCPIHIVDRNKTSEIA